MAPKRTRGRRSKKRTTQAFRQKVLGVMNRRMEMKQKWSSWDETAVNTLQAATFYDLAAIDQGDASNQRDGNEIHLQGFHFNGIINNNSTTLTNYVRVLVFRSIQDNLDLSYASSDLFAGTLGDPEALSDRPGLNAMYWPIDKGLFKVYKDILIKVSPNTATDGSETKRLKFWIPLKGLKVRYEGSSTGATNVYPRLHFVMWSGEAPDDTSTGSNVEFSGVGRLFYKD